MALGDGKMFPLVDRDTPAFNKLIERGSGKHLGRAIGKLAGMSMTRDPDDEDMEEKANFFLQGFGQGLASELEIADEAIDEQELEQLGHWLFGRDTEDFLTDEAKMELGIGELEEELDELVEVDDDDGGSDSDESDDSDDTSFSQEE